MTRHDLEQLLVAADYTCSWSPDETDQLGHYDQRVWWETLMGQLQDPAMRLPSNVQDYYVISAPADPAIGMLFSEPEGLWAEYISWKLTGELSAPIELTGKEGLK